MGRVLGPKLLKRGHSVCSLVRDRSRVENLRSLPIKVSYGDLADLESLTTACRGTDVVFHTAAFATHWGKRRDYWHANVVGTRNVLEAMAVSGVKRLIHFSSFAVYGFQNGLRAKKHPAVRAATSIPIQKSRRSVSCETGAPPRNCRYDPPSRCDLWAWRS